MTDAPLTQVDAIFTPWDNPDRPGCAVAVIRAGEVVASRGYGLANLEYAQPIIPESVFVVGSVAKQFTACAVSLLAQQGHLSLDARVRDYLPDLPDYCSPVTIRQMLHHTSGIRDFWPLFSLAGKPSDGVYTEGDILEVVRRQRGLDFTPGTRFSYSNTGYILLAMTIARASGQTLRRYAREHIFAPLGMDQSQFVDDHRLVVPQRVDGYEHAPDGAIRRFMPHNDLVGQGGLMTTVVDLARWDGNFYAPLVGGQDLIAQLQEPGVLVDGRRLDYARGLVIGTYRGATTVSHAGGTAGYRAEVLRFPDHRFSVACLANTAEADATALAYRVADVYLDAQLAPPPPRPARMTSYTDQGDMGRGDVQAMVGTYWNDDTFSLQTVAAQGDHALWGEGEGAAMLVPVGDGRFGVEDLPIELRLVASPDGGADELRVRPSAQSPDDAIYRRVSVPLAAHLTVYPGTYDSAELATAYVVTLADGMLTLAHPTVGSFALHPINDDTFAVREWQARVHFLRGHATEIMAFDLSFARATDVHFAKRSGGALL